MARSRPPTELPDSVVREVALAGAVDAAVAGLVPGDRRRPGHGTDVEAGGDPAVADALDALDEGPGGTGTHPGWDRRAGRLPLVLLDGLEVTQEVQDLAHSVPLVAGKPTIVRVYLRYPPEAVSVRGDLLVARTARGPWHAVPSLGPAELDPSRSGSSPTELRSRRAALPYSLAFRLPTELTGAGTLWLRMGTVRRTTGTPLPSLARLAVHTVTFRPPVVLRLRLVRLRYRTGNPPVVHQPSAADVALIHSWLRRAYPIARLEATTTTVDAPAPAPFDAAQVNAQLIALRTVDVSTGTDARTHYYGMVADTGFFMRGLASGIPGTPRPGTVASGPTGPSSFGWDGDGSYGDWYGGHELSHTFGRLHAEFCGAAGGGPYPFPDGRLSDDDEAFVGVDVGDPAVGLPLRVLPGTTAHDVMSYCADQWLSSFTYAGIYDRLVAEEALPAGSGPAVEATAAADAPAVHLVAAIDLARGSATIAAVLPATRGDDAPVSGRVAVRLLDADGSVLAERPVAFQPSAVEEPGSELTGVVDAVVPLPPGAAALELLVDGRPVTGQPVGGAPVDVGALGIAESTGADPAEGLTLRWEAPAGPTGQRYVVQVSDDGGAGWRTVAVGLAEPAVTLALDELTGAEVAVRVLASTGTGTRVVRTDTVPLR